MAIEILLTEQELYHKVSLLVNSFVNTHRMTKEEFLIRALDSAFQLIPEAEKGSLYIEQNGIYSAVCGKGYDMELLKKVSFTKEDLFIGFECTDVDAIESYENYIDKRIDEKFTDEMLETFKQLGTYSHFTSLYAPLQYEGNLFGLISLERFDDDSFSVQSKEIIRFYAQSISNFYALKQKQEKEKQMYNETIAALATAIEIKDSYTEGHARRCMLYSEWLAIALQIPTSTIESLMSAALLHDIGKIGIPNEILDKPGKLTAEEYEIIKRHPENAKRILENIAGFADVISIAYLHHEHYDGTGYPQGLKGDEIPMCAHILQLADAYDAMTSKRAYREAMTHEKAISILIEESGKQFHPDVVTAAVAFFTYMRVNE